MQQLRSGRELVWLKSGLNIDAAAVSITGSVRMTPTTALKVLFGLRPLHLLTEAEAKAQLTGLEVSMCGLVSAEPLVMLVSLHDKCSPDKSEQHDTNVCVWPPFKVDIPVREQWLSTCLKG
jgi:hypothetical protein